MTARKRRTAFAKLNTLYGRSYYTGKSSGYGPGGYAEEHPSWDPFVSIIRKWRKKARWLDMGCAYGYLVDEARKQGLQAFGLDVSLYALSRLEDARPHVAGSLAEELPVASASVDVVTCFDLLEHLSDPGRALDEALRALRPGGILLLSTPDPLRFDLEEPSHCHERAPSHWLNELTQRGCTVRFGFGSLDYELILAASNDPKTEVTLSQLVAARRETPVPLEVRGGHLWAADRGAWAVDETGTVAGEGNEVYFIAGEGGAQRLQVELTLSTERTPRLEIDDLTLRHTGVKPSNEEDENTGYRHRWEASTVWPGGHSLRIHPDTGDRCGVLNIQMSENLLDRQAALRQLPFDQYQRYQHLSVILQTLGHIEAGHSILEVGAKRSRLTEFLPEGAPYQGTDLEWDDRPSFVTSDGTALGLEDKSVDVVVAVDVLEHIPVDRRTAVLDEMMRVSARTVVVAGPFDTPHAAACDRLVQRFRAARGIEAHAYLDEHVDLGLPDLEASGAAFNDAGWKTALFPNGHVGWWALGQVLTYGMDLCAELAPGREALQELLTGPLAGGDFREPAYRHALIATRRAIPQAATQELAALVEASETQSWGADPTAFVAPLIQVFGLDVLRDREAALSVRNEQIDNLLKHVDALGREREQLQSLLQNLEKHSQNLEKHSQDLDARLEEAQKHGKNLESDLKATIQHATNIEGEIEQVGKRHEQLAEHAEELLIELRESEARRQQLVEHADNLANQLKEQTANQSHLVEHAANLETQLTAAGGRQDRLTEHTKNLETQIAASDARRDRLNEHITNLEGQLTASGERQDRLTEHVTNQEARLAASNERLDRFVEHIKNLETQLTDSSKQREATLKHAANLETQLRDSGKQREATLKHAANLEALLKDSAKQREATLKHAANLEKTLKERLAQTNEFEEERVARQQHAAELLGARDQAAKRIHELEDLIERERAMAGREQGRLESELRDIQAKWYTKFGKKLGG